MEKTFTEKNPYHQALLTELSFYKPLLAHDISSVYMGGGSPLELPSWQIVPFLEFLSQNFLLSHAEKTIESNPDILKIPQAYTQFFNRISVGIQSFLPKSRKLLGRTHVPQETFLQMAKDTFKKVSLDMIWDIPGQSQKELEQDIEKVITKNFGHISWYALEDPPKEVSKGSLQRYQTIQKELSTNGFEMYEISNYSKPGQNSIHNLAYWNHNYYVGLGPGSCGFIPTLQGPLRYTNEFSIPKYCKAIQDGKFPYFQSEILGKKEICNEKILLGLRLEKGIDLQDLQDNYDLNFSLHKQKILQKYARYLQISDGKSIKLSLEGKLFYNTICSELLL